MNAGAQSEEQQKNTLESLWDIQEDLSVGEILRRAREYYNLGLDDVERALRIRREQLHALEQDNFETLPGKVYAIGFVRTYSEYLGLDGARMVNLYKKQAGGKFNKPQAHIPVPASESKLPNLLILGVSTLILVLSVVGYNILSGDKEPAGIGLSSIEEKSAVDVGRLYKTPLEYTVAGALEESIGADGPEKFIKPPGRVVVSVTDSSWVEIKDSKGEILISKVLKAGDQYIVPDDRGAVMATGNIGALVFTVDGRALPPLGEQAEVKRSLSLAPDDLLSAVTFAP